MKKIFILLFCTLARLEIAFAQDLILEHTLSVSVSLPEKFRVLVSYNLHGRSHLPRGKDMAFTPFFDLKLSLLKNHLGCPVFPTQKLPFNGALSLGALVSGVKRQAEGYLPVFSPTFANSFNTDYAYNAGYATTYVWHTGLPGDRNFPTQKVGSIMLSAGDFYILYANDGGPLGLSFFGDGEDRYWTGSIVAGFFDRSNGGKRQFELSFEKFTGFTKKAFEAAGLLFVDNVIYANPEQTYYTTGRTVFKFIDHRNGLGAAFNTWNAPFDLQDWTHRDITNNPYHAKIEKKYFDVEFFKIYTP